MFNLSKKNIIVGYRHTFKVVLRSRQTVLLLEAAEILFGFHMAHKVNSKRQKVYGAVLILHKKHLYIGRMDNKSRLPIILIVHSHSSSFFAAAAGSTVVFPRRCPLSTLPHEPWTEAAGGCVGAVACAVKDLPSVAQRRGGRGQCPRQSHHPESELSLEGPGHDRFPNEVVSDTGRPRCCRRRRRERDRPRSRSPR